LQHHDVLHVLDRAGDAVGWNGGRLLDAVGKRGGNASPAMVCRNVRRPPEQSLEPRPSQCSASDRWSSTRCWVDTATSTTRARPHNAHGPGIAVSPEELQQELQEQQRISHDQILASFAPGLADLIAAADAEKQRSADQGWS
jgi:hypothetical protein